MAPLHRYWRMLPGAGFSKTNIRFDYIAFILQLLHSNCSYCTMRMPWNCPYCSHTTNRRWNASVHVMRNHKNKYNPFPDLKQKKSVSVTFFDSSQTTKARNVPAINPVDPTDPWQTIQKSQGVQNTINELSRMSKQQIDIVLMAIIRIYSNLS